VALQLAVCRMALVTLNEVVEALAPNILILFLFSERVRVQVRYMLSPVRLSSLCRL